MLKALAELDARLNGNERAVQFHLSGVRTLGPFNRGGEAGLEVEGFLSQEPCLEDLSSSA